MTIAKTSIFLGVVLLAGCSTLEQPFKVASGFTSHTVCSDTFITGRDPEQAFAERILAMPAMWIVKGRMAMEVDRTNRSISANVAGQQKTRAVYRGEQGCLLLDSPESPVPPFAETRPMVGQASLPPIAGTALVQTDNPRLAAVLDAALVDAPETPHRHQVKAVLVLKGGKLIAERYAPGYGVATPQQSFSMNKSITSTLIGLLVRDGKLKLDQAVTIADTGQTATLEQLLRQTSGSGITQSHTGFDTNARMLYMDTDPVAFARAVKPKAPSGALWEYSEAHYVLLSRVLRDAVGGRAEDVIAYAQRELFAPLGMAHVTLEFDKTGTPFGANHMFASARDYARFGQFFLNRGMAGERRLLPESWVDGVSTPTLQTGYGAGFWTNRVPGINPDWGVPWGFADAPPDTFFARGYMGQFIIVIPSRQMVIVRLGISQYRGDDIESVNDMVRQVLAAVKD